MTEVMDERTELRHRIKAKRKDLQARIEKAKADAGATANEEIERFRQRLSELENILKDGWENLSESAAAKLNQWLKKT